LYIPWVGNITATVSGRETLRKKASETVLYDLVNALLHENLLGIIDRGIVTTSCCDTDLLPQWELEDGEFYFRLDVDTARSLLFRVRPQRFIQPYRLSRLPVLLISRGAEGVTAESLDPVGLMRILADSVLDEDRAVLMPNLDGFLTELENAVEHTALSMEAAQSFDSERDGFPPSPFLRMERLSSLRDRPFHPTSRAKKGWDRNAYRTYSPEFGHSFGLDWVALRRDYLIQGEKAGAIQDLLLQDDERQQLEEAMVQAGLHRRDYAVLPVHPWQMKHVLPELFQQEMGSGICIPLMRGLGRFVATSSVRTLSPVHNDRYHIKLPIGIFSLAALRIVPPRYLANGVKGQRLLEQLIEREPMLHKRLHLCREEMWFGFHDPQGDPFEDKPGHLACLIREYPDHLVGDSEVQLIAMSSLAVTDPNGQLPVFSGLLRSRYGQTDDTEHVLGLFREICEPLIRTALIAFRYGMMPEIHGQNVLLVIKGGRIDGLMLRDHDTVRVHLPWLEREGLADPGYIVKPGTPNSLILESPEALLSYFQTLGIQVNLYAIIDVLSRVYTIDEALFWRVIRDAIQTCLATLDLPETVRDVAVKQLLTHPTWPTRLLIAPLLKRTGTGGGGMPAGTGETHNPLRSLER
jgi:staphyloferrin B synthase